MVLLNITNFFTGDLNESIATQGSPAVNNTAPVRTGEFSLKLAPAATQEQYDWPFIYGLNGTPATNNNHHVLMGFAIRIATDKTPAASREFLTLLDDGGAREAGLILEADGDVSVINAAGAVVTSGTVGDPFTLDTWHYVELYVERVASGAWELFIDGASAASGSGEDFEAAGTPFQTMRFGGMAASEGSIAIDDPYTESQVASQPPRHSVSATRLPEVFAYQNDQVASTASDTGLTTNDTNLEQGTWATTGEDPISVESPDSAIAGYNGTATTLDGAINFDDAGGARNKSGPTGGVPTVDGAIVGAKFFYWIERGNGGGTTHQAWRGNSGDGCTQSGDLSLANSPSDRSFVEVSASIVPLSSEVFAMGFGKNNGARDLFCHEMFAALLHVPPAAPGGARLRRLLLGQGL